MSSEYLLVPVELCKYAISNHIENQFFTFILLKKSISGVGRIDARVKDQLSKRQGKSIKTINRYLERLNEIGFISFSQTNQIHIVSWKEILEILKIDHYTGVKCYSSTIKDPQAFCIGAVTGRLVNENRLKEKRDPWRAQKRKARALYPRLIPLFQECADRALAEVCKISPSSANRLKRKAEENKHLHLVKNIQKIIIDGRHISLEKRDIKSFRKFYPDFKQIIIRKGKAYSVGPNLIKSRMRFKKSQNYC